MGFLNGLLGKDAPKAPEAPDPRVVADAQTGINRNAAFDSAALNRFNQSNPYGSLTWVQNGVDERGVPRYEARVSLSPEQQGLLNTYQGVQQQRGNLANQLLQNYSGRLTNLPDRNQLSGIYMPNPGGGGGNWIGRNPMQPMGGNPAGGGAPPQGMPPQGMGGPPQAMPPNFEKPASFMQPDQQNSNRLAALQQYMQQMQSQVPSMQPGQPPQGDPSQMNKPAMLAQLLRR